jgi:hypothetical protein
MIALVSRNQILLAGLCSALALVLVYELAMPAAAIDVPAALWQPPPSPGPLAMAAPLPSAQSFSAIDTRPLFNPARKPVQAPPDSAAVAVTPPPSDISLIGVIIDGDRKLAMLRTPSSPLEVGVSLGSQINGWQVIAILPDRIVLRSGTTDYPIGLNAVHGGTPAVGPANGAGPGSPPVEVPPPPPSNADDTAPTESGDR